MKISIWTRILDFFTLTERCPNDGTLIEYNDDYGKYSICKVCGWNPKYPEDKLQVSYSDTRQKCGCPLYGHYSGCKKLEEKK